MATECVICNENITEQDLLLCGHYSHRSCIKQWTDTMQDYRTQNGYPPIKFGYCPICKAELSDIIAKKVRWVGLIEIERPCIIKLLELINEHHFINGAEIPNEIRQQMPNAHIDEQILFANTAASILWVGGYSPTAVENLPIKLRLMQYAGGAFRNHLLFTTF